jgi:NADH-quinone oxidoreductase subunit M
MLLTDILFETLISGPILYLADKAFDVLQIKQKELHVKQLALYLSTFIFIHALTIFFYYDPMSDDRFFLEQEYFFNSFFDFINPVMCFSVDGIALGFILLTTFIMPLCILCSWRLNIKFSLLYWILFFVIEGLILFCFMVNDIFLFFISFEAILIPMFLVIGIWGSRTRKIKAAYYFFFYTFISSIFFLLGILILWWQIGTTDYLSVSLFTKWLSLDEQKLLWFLFFFTFAVKIPMFPFHIWLPEAHVEAPTAGSVILAALLLKLGGFGFLKFLIPLFPLATLYFLPFVNMLAVLGIIYGSFIIFRQIDLKKIIAYSSVIHMNLVVLGIFSLNLQALAGSVILMLAHGLVSAALFILVGFLYERHFSKSIFYYTGLTMAMPYFSFYFLFFSFANLGFPGLGNFIGELLIILGISNSFFLMEFNFWILLTLFFSLFFSALYSVWLCNRICFGTLRLKSIKFYSDLDNREIFILTLLAFYILLLGIYPKFFLDFLICSSKHILIDYI